MRVKFRVAASGPFRVAEQPGARHPKARPGPHSTRRQSDGKFPSKNRPAPLSAARVWEYAVRSARLPTDTVLSSPNRPVAAHKRMFLGISQVTTLPGVEEFLEATETSSVQSYVSEAVKKNHLRNIFDKLGVSDRLELALTRSTTASSTRARAS